MKNPMKFELYGEGISPVVKINVRAFGIAKHIIVRRPNRKPYKSVFSN